MKRYCTFDQGKQEQSKNSICETKAPFYVIRGVIIFI